MEEIKTRMNKKNQEIVSSWRALGGKTQEFCKDTPHQMLDVMTGSTKNVKLKLRECVVCAYIEWVEK